MTYVPFQCITCPAVSQDSLLILMADAGLVQRIMQPATTCLCRFEAERVDNHQIGM